MCTVKWQSMGLYLSSLFDTDRAIAWNRKFIENVTLFRPSFQCCMLFRTDSDLRKMTCTLILQVLLFLRKRKVCETPTGVEGRYSTTTYYPRLYRSLWYVLTYRGYFWSVVIGVLDRSSLTILVCGGYLCVVI
jgi:hypothetical protein